MIAIKNALLFIITILFSGCVTGDFGKFYNQVSMQNFPPVQEARVFAYTDQSLNDLKLKGYTVIGYSSFNGSIQNKQMAITHAKKIGADVVLLNQTYSGSTQKMMLLPQYYAPQTTTVNTYSSGRTNAFGSGGYAFGNYSGHSTSNITTPGYTTYNQFPITVDRYDQYAVFLRSPNAK